MKSFSSLLLRISVALVTAGCGSSDDAVSPAQVSSEWTELLSGDWTLPAGTEDYVCVRQTLTEDIYVEALEPINPLGTHHTFLTLGDPDEPDGVTACNVAENHTLSIFGSGVGTNPIELPEGVAMKLSAGKQLLLNLHLFNAGDEALSGTSGTRVVRVDESDVDYIGENRPALTLDLNILPHEDTVTSFVIAMKADTTIFAVLPHMHQLGIHAKVVAKSSIEGERVLHDAPYDFESQLYYAIDPIRMATGDELTLECTWRNTTERTIVFGDSSLDEMCAIGLYQYAGVQ